MNIPFLDLKTINLLHKDALIEAFNNVLNSGSYILGEQLEGFEREFAAYHNIRYCVGVGSGLDALTLSLNALNLNIGDEVLIPANTFIASFLAATAAGLKPVPVDIDPDTLLMSKKSILDAVTSKTKVIMPVHLFGQVCNMDELQCVAKEYNLHIVEDCAQAHGALYKSNHVGTFSDVSAFSFYPGKNLGALGDGGAILTNSLEVKNSISMQRNYGSLQKYHHDIVGCNSRLDELQAAFLRIKLKSLDESNNERKIIAEYYLKNITNAKVRFIQPGVNTTPSWHLFVVRVKNRDSFMEYLKDRNIMTLIHYPIPCHQQKSNLELNSYSCPVAEQVSSEIVSLPIYPGMGNEQADYIVRAINEW